MPKALRTSLVMLAVSAAASGCAGSRSTATTQTAPPHYSVGEVVRAFASQGIELSRVHEGHVSLPGAAGLTPSQRRKLERHIREESRGEFFLRAGKSPHAVFALLNVPYVAGTPTAVPVMKTARGNLVVTFDPSQRAAVHAALARLH